MSDLTRNDFGEWLAQQDPMTLPVVAWSHEHTIIAVRFARDMAKRAVTRTLDQALNSGDGSYKP